MYYYLYDTFLADKKYEKVIDRIKTRLLDLEIQGKHEKLTLLKSAEELIKDEVKRGASTIIVVGNDKSFLKVVDVVAKSDVSIGLIPVGSNNNIAKSLGVPMEDAACDILAARKVVKFDLGQVGDHYFFSNLKITKNLDRLSIEKDNYKVIPTAKCAEISVSNFYFPLGKDIFEKKMKKYSAQDKKLELVVKLKGKSKGWIKKKEEVAQIDTIIQSEKFEIKSFEYLPIVLDEYKVIKTPVTVDVAPMKLKVIVGRDRQKKIK